MSEEKKEYKEYDGFYMQFGFKQDIRPFKSQSTFTESKFWEREIKNKHNKTKLKQ